MDADGKLVRLHQEDLCQAMGIHPESKYENDGGPGIAEIMQILKWSAEPEKDRRRFLQAITLNLLLLGTDAHAKNYSLIFSPGKMRLAPLYDIGNYSPPRNLTVVVTP
jgi:serine/threonine-protein kinase HipA